MGTKRTNIAVLVSALLAVTLYLLYICAPASPPAVVESFYHTMIRKAHFPSLQTRVKFGSSDVWRGASGVDGKSNISSEVLHPIADRTFYMLKTGAEVMWDRLPIHLETTLKRFPHHQIYSDAPAQIGNESVLDIVANATAEIRDEQLSPYHALRSQYDNAWGWQADKLKMEDLNTGWTTDKFKNIPMAYHAYLNAPKSCDWFVFADDDTYMHSQSLGALLSDLNPKDSHYIGSVALIDGGFALSGKVWEKRVKLAKVGEEPEGLVFAHGGSGVIVSRGALDALFWDPQRNFYLVQKYSELGMNLCCGDAMFGYMLREETELDVNAAFTNGELETDPFFGEGVGETKLFLGRKEGECQRVISWHHLEPESIQRLFDWERTVMNRKPEGGISVMYSDVYADFILPYIQPARDYWRIKADADTYRGDINVFYVEDKEMQFESDEVKQAVDDADFAPAANDENCKLACDLHPKCLAYMFEAEFGDEPSSCRLEHTVIMRGTNTHPYLGTEESLQYVVSGYNVDRIRKLRAQEKCDWLEYDEETQSYNDNELEREGWYFRELRKEQGGVSDQPVYGN